MKKRKTKPSIKAVQKARAEFLKACQERFKEKHLGPALRALSKAAYRFRLLPNKKIRKSLIKDEEPVYLFSIL